MASKIDQKHFPIQLKKPYGSQLVYFVSEYQNVFSEMTHCGNDCDLILYVLSENIHCC